MDKWNKIHYYAVLLILHFNWNENIWNMMGGVGEAFYGKLIWQACGGTSDIKV